MRAAILDAVLLALATGASAQTASSCVNQAAEKEIYGAARTSFLDKCERDAKAQCDSAAASKKLAGAAKTSFTKKCVTDAVGS